MTQLRCINFKQRPPFLGAAQASLEEIFPPLRFMFMTLRQIQPPLTPLSLTLSMPLTARFNF